MKKIVISLLALGVFLTISFSAFSCNKQSPGNSSQTRDNSNTDGQSSPSNSKTLVAYFSCTGNTRKLAKNAQSVFGADLFEIVPEVAYTQADLNYNDSTSRATREQNDSDASVAMNGKCENISGYDKVIVCYPIWWGIAPKIINTFVKEHDLSGKTVTAICTSGSSGIGSSMDNLKTIAKGSGIRWVDGKRFVSPSSDSDETTKSSIREWASSVNLI